MSDERTDLDGAQQVHVAVVYSADGVRFVAASPSEAELTAQVAAYVQREAPRQLATREAGRVRDLLDRGRSQAAIDLYFNANDVRWDVESLSMHIAPLASSARDSLPVPCSPAILTAQSLSA